MNDTENPYIEDYNPICLKYSMRIGNEAGFLGELVNLGYESMYRRTLTHSKDMMKILSDQAIRASLAMEIVYLVNLFESFMTDLIIYRDSLDEDIASSDNGLKQHLKETNSQWQEFIRKNNDAVNTSTSFMNIRYSLFVLERKYGIKFPFHWLCNAIPELGSLRNSLVHHNGNLDKTDKGGNFFRDTLRNTISMNMEENSYIVLNQEFVNKVIFDLQDFVAYVGGMKIRD